MRWLCTFCDVEWSTTGADHGPCWSCDSAEHIEMAFDVPAWAWGYRP